MKDMKGSEGCREKEPVKKNTPKTETIVFFPKPSQPATKMHNLWGRN